METMDIITIIITVRILISSPSCCYFELLPSIEGGQQWILKIDGWGSPSSSFVLWELKITAG